MDVDAYFTQKIVHFGHYNYDDDDLKSDGTDMPRFASKLLPCTAPYREYSNRSGKKKLIVNDQAWDSG